MSTSHNTSHILHALKISSKILLSLNVLITLTDVLITLDLQLMYN